MFTIYGVYYINDGDWTYYATKCGAYAEAEDFVRDEAAREKWPADELEDALKDLSEIGFVDDVVGIYDLEVNN